MSTVAYFLGIFMVLAGLGLGASSLLIQRSLAVHEFRSFLIDRMEEAALREIMRGGNPSWRFDAFSKVSFEAMLWCFWRPLKVQSWWDNPDFVEEDRS